MVKNLPDLCMISPVFLPGKFHEQRRLVGYIPWAQKMVGHSLATKQQQLSVLSSVGWQIRCGFPSGSAGEESACNAGDTGASGLIPGSGRSPGGGNGNPLQYSCLENPMDKGAWWATVQRVTELDRIVHTH